MSITKLGVLLKPLWLAYSDSALAREGQGATTLLPEESRNPGSPLTQGFVWERVLRMAARQGHFRLPASLLLIPSHLAGVGLPCFCILHGFHLHRLEGDGLIAPDQNENLDSLRGLSTAFPRGE